MTDNLGVGKGQVLPCYTKLRCLVVDRRSQHAARRSANTQRAKDMHAGLAESSVPRQLPAIRLAMRVCPFVSVGLGIRDREVVK